MSNPYQAFRRWLEWLDSEEGIDHRKKCGGVGDEYDLACTIPTPPGKTLITIGDLRFLVSSLDKYFSEDKS